jgi:hypothetical protein
MLGGDVFYRRPEVSTHAKSRLLFPTLRQLVYPIPPGQTLSYVLCDPSPALHLPGIQGLVGPLQWSTLALLISSSVGLLIMATFHDFGSARQRLYETISRGGCVPRTQSEGSALCNVIQWKIWVMAEMGE